jgi:hypothetical protein
LVAPDGLVFFTDGPLCRGRAGAGVLSDILNVRKSYVLGSHATVFQSEVYAIRSIWNIAFWRALSTEQYQSDLIVGLLCWPLNHMPCLPELYYSAEILSKSWFCLTEFELVWVPGHCGTHENEEADALARAGSNSAFVGTEPWDS